MIRMFMCDQNAIKVTSGKLQTIQASFHFLTADPDIYQYMCIVRSYINTVSAASAGNATKSHIF